MAEEVRPNYLTGVLGNFHSPDSLQLPRKQRQHSRSILKVDERITFLNIFLWIPISLLINILCVTDDIFHQPGIALSIPFFKGFEFLSR